MDIQVFSFPILSDGVTAVEEAYCGLLNKYRQGEVLDTEELDWMDSAGLPHSAFGGAGALSCHSWRGLALLANTLKMRATVYHKG
jgi:hypothetical protein